jgi:hypothetical protein
LLLLLLLGWADADDMMMKNPYPPEGNCAYNTWNEGCNWLYEGFCKDIDFVSIHTWADQWWEKATHDTSTYKT